MKLSNKLYSVSILGILILLSAFFYIDRQTSIFTQRKSIPQNNSILLQEAKNTLSEGYKASDDQLINQAIDKYSMWLNKNWDNPDKKIISGVLIVRANAFLRLKKPNDAIRDFKKSTEYNHSGDIQFGICMLEKEQGNVSILHDCYVKAVQYFENKKVSTTNLGFLVARILSGDKSAIVEYKNVFQTLTGDKKWMYEEAAKMFLDNAIYKQITGKECDDCGHFKMLMDSN